MQNFTNINPMQQQQLGRSQTPNFMNNPSAPIQMQNNFDNNIKPNIEEFLPFANNPNSISQNFNQMTKVMTPHNNLIDPNFVNEIALGTAGQFPEIQPSSFQSPNDQLTSAIGTIGSGIMANQAPSQSNFQGNGNLNPPVRQNGKMSNMTVRTKFGTLGTGKAQFNSPHGFCLGVDEEIIVADTNNHRIHIFDKNGEFKYSFGAQGREEGQLWFPRKVAVIRSSGKFVVCDRGNERSRMQIFSNIGIFEKKISIRYIDIVAGLAIASNGDIIAVDSVSPTVFRISEGGDLVKWFDCSDYMREPSDIAISNNEFFVCDFKGEFSNNILKLNSD